MLERIIIAVVTHLGSWLLSKALEKTQKSKEQAATENEVDQKLKPMKDAFIEAFNGQPVTSEQKKNLRSAIVNFVKSDSGGL